MKAIRIIEENRERLAEALAEAQKTYRVRLLEVDDLFRFVQRLETILHPWPKRLWKGAEFFVSHHYSKFPASYRGVPTKTGAQMRFNGRDWALTKVVRTTATGPAIGLLDSKKAQELGEWAAKALTTGQWARRF